MVCQGNVQVSPGVSVPLVRFIAEKTCLAGMPEVCLGMSGYVRVYPGSFLTQSVKAHKADLGGYARGMSGYVGGMSGYDRVSLVVSVPLVHLNAQKKCLAGIPEVCLCMSGYIRVCPGSF